MLQFLRSQNISSLDVNKALAQNAPHVRSFGIVLEESNDEDSEEDSSKDKGKGKGKAVITPPTTGSSRYTTRAATATLAVATTNAKAKAKATLEEMNKEA